MRRACFSLFLLGSMSCSAAVPARKTVSIPVSDGGHLAAVLFGEGADTVVVLPGGPGFGAAYLRDLLAPLARERVFVLLDLRGRGRSTRAATPTFAMDVGDVEAARAYLRLSRFAVVAHHYGALVGAEYAVRHPGRVSRIAALGPFPPRARYQFDLASEPRDSAWQRRVASLYHDGIVESDPARFCREAWEVHLAPADRGDTRVIQALSPAMCDASVEILRRRGEVKAGILQSLGDWEWRDSLRRLPIPLWVAAGAGDRVLLHSARTWAHYAADGGISELNAPPLFPWVGRDREVRSGLRAFLGGTWPTSARKPSYAEVRAPGDTTATERAGSR